MARKTTVAQVTSAERQAGTWTVEPIRAEETKRYEGNDKEQNADAKVQETP